VHIPNELMLTFTDCLDLDDINTLVRTTRALNRLLTPYIYRRAKDLRSRNPYRRPYFLRAVDAGNLTAVRHFIEVGTSVNMSDPAELFVPTALHRCVCGGYIEIAQLLIQHGVKMSPVNHFGDTPLHKAIGGKSEEIWARLLVDAGADICARTEYGETILSWATTCGKLSAVQFLLERGAIPTTRNRRSSTLLHNSLHRVATSRSAANSNSCWRQG
jgi:ankyrin repeat protein